jgi:hypothetical protein
MEMPLLLTCQSNGLVELGLLRNAEKGEKSHTVTWHSNITSLNSICLLTDLAINVEMPKQSSLNSSKLLKITLPS